jgi:hypothetical protein
MTAFPNRRTSVVTNASRPTQVKLNVQSAKKKKGHSTDYDSKQGYKQRTGN